MVRREGRQAVTKKTKVKRATTNEYLYSIDMANKQTDIRITNLIKEINDLSSHVVEELQLQRQEINRLNNTIYEDRAVLANFVAKFLKYPNVFEPKFGIVGERKAKRAPIKRAKK
jgi:tRNA uridine 5-carbamoylmethylation protein Kti12